MTLESTIICVDNSEYCRNGDFGLNRLISQQDAANLVARYPFFLYRFASYLVLEQSSSPTLKMTLVSLLCPTTTWSQL